MNVPQLTSTKQ